jgi:hypothetical protein
MRKVARRLLAAVLAGALLGAPAAFAEVVDHIAIDQRGQTARIQLRLTVPVRYVRHSPPERGQLVVVVLEALAAERLGPISPIEEVKRTRETGRVPRFTVRVSLDPTCNPASARPLCLVLRFERPVRYRVRLGPDSRSIVVDVLPQERTP